jgi:hypothetical protein
MRACLFAFALLASPVLAETDHLIEANGLRVLHVWTPATSKGADALIYMDVENASAAPAMLTGGIAGAEPLDLVGFSYGASGETWTVLPGLPVPAGGEVLLEPSVLALRWQAVPMDLVEGAGVEILVKVGAETLAAHVEIGSAVATGHSHAGHSH